MTWANGSNLRDSDDRCHVGADGMIFDNRNEMEVVAKIRRKSRKGCTPGEQRQDPYSIDQSFERVRVREYLWEHLSSKNRRSSPNAVKC